MKTYCVRSPTLFHVVAERMATMQVEVVAWTMLEYCRLTLMFRLSHRSWSTPYFRTLIIWSFGSVEINWADRWTCSHIAIINTKPSKNKHKKKSRAKWMDRSTTMQQPCGPQVPQSPWWPGSNVASPSPWMQLYFPIRLRYRRGDNHHHGAMTRTFCRGDSCFFKPKSQDATMSNPFLSSSGHRCICAKMEYAPVRAEPASRSRFFPRTSLNEPTTATANLVGLMQWLAAWDQTDRPVEEDPSLCTMGQLGSWAGFQLRRV